MANLAVRLGTAAVPAAPARELLEALWADGTSVAAYDAKAPEEAQRLYTGALVIRAEWKHYSWARLRLHGAEL